MNEKQKKILTAVLFVIAGMLILPPFHVRLPNGATRSLGYGFIFDPLKFSANYAASVDIGLLITQWVGVLLVGGIAFFLFKDR